VHRAILASGDGINFRDSDGNALTAIGNVTYKAGDAVWTDGRCIYGWVRPNQPNALQFPAGGYDCPWLEAGGWYPSTAYVLPFARPRDMKKLCDLGEWVIDAYGIFVAGEAACWIIAQSGNQRYAVQVETGEKITLAVPDRSSYTGTPYVYDACVDGEGNLLFLEVYNDTSGNYVGIAVHRNDEIIDTVESIEGGEHEETSYCSPMALHLFDDGSFCGTLREDTALDNELFVDEWSEIEQEDISVDTSGIIIHTTPGHPIESEDVTAWTYDYYLLGHRYRIQPFKDFQAVHRSRTGVFSGSLYYYDSADGKTEIYKQTDNRDYEQDYPFAKIDGAYYDEYGYTITSATGPDMTMTVVFQQKYIRSIDGQEINKYCFSLEASTIVSGNKLIMAEALINWDFITEESAKIAYPAFYKGWAVVTSDPAEEGTAYDYELDDGAISCAAPSNPSLNGLGVFQRGALLPQGFTGSASVRGLSFEQAEMQVFDAVKVSGGYLLLTTGGTYFSHGGTTELIRGGFRAFVNTRIRESDDIDAVRDGLARNTLD
jgi:hypothetical protein